MSGNKWVRFFFLAFYYGIAVRLPRTYTPLALGAGRFRQFICRRLFKYMGRNVNIEEGAYFGWGNLLSIGDNSGLRVNCQCTGPITLGKDVMMRPDVMIPTVLHETSGATRPMRGQGLRENRPLVIEDDVWVAMRAIILPRVTVHRGAIFGAGAAVTEDVPPYAVVGRGPARVLKCRTTGPALLNSAPPPSSASNALGAGKGAPSQ